MQRDHVVPRGREINTAFVRLGSEEMESVGLNVFGIAFLAIMIGLTLSLPRRSATLPLLITAAYMPLGQAIVIGGVSFQILRILLAISWVRVLSRGENHPMRFSRVDQAFVIWGIVSLILGAFTQPAVVSERLVNRLGESYNAFGSYFLFRCWIRNSEDFVRVIQSLAIVVMPLAGFMILEKLSGRNAFFIFGGVPEFTAIREGKLRCQGAFRHPILAGTYGATLLPLFIGLWKCDSKFRRRATVGIVGAVIITIASASSGALLTLMGVLIGFGLWRFRLRMRTVRWCCLISLVCLHIAMKAPVWFLIARLSEIAGGTGWYRSYNIDAAITHFHEWWLVGTRYTAHWAPGGEIMAGNPGNMDILNQFVSEGLDGGILKMGLFIWMIAVAFGAIGRITSRRRWNLWPSQVFVWSVGVCLTAHCVSFFSVVYFDQIVLMWYMLLAAIAIVEGMPIRASIEKMGRGKDCGTQLALLPESMVNR